MHANEIETYVRTNGRRVTTYGDRGGPESGPMPYIDDQYIRLGNLELRESDAGVFLIAANRRITRSKTAFAMNEPVAAGATVVIKDTLPEFPF